jgi:hypothetical protein
VTAGVTQRTHDEREVSSQQIGLLGESQARIEFEQASISFHDVKPDTLLQLRLVHWTRLHRARIALV